MAVFPRDLQHLIDEGEVVIRTLTLGHPFTQGTVDSNEVWVDVTGASGSHSYPDGPDPTPQCEVDYGTGCNDFSSSCNQG